MRRASVGSSPRVRGKLHRVDTELEALRLIPARAGKTTRPGCPRSSWRAHPRACGENDGHVTAGITRGGSSPRVRGKHPPLPVHRRPHRLIPARAGKTPGRLQHVRRPQAHPRACGENSYTPVIAFPQAGSSPRVRGKHDPHPRGEPRPRLIPARAGKTGKPLRSSAGLPAHPRACGENDTSTHSWAGRGGSSPRVRGKPRCHLCGDAIDRLIPARAGKTTPSS